MAQIVVAGSPDREDTRARAAVVRSRYLPTALIVRVDPARQPTRSGRSAAPTGVTRAAEAVLRGTVAPAAEWRQHGAVSLVATRRRLIEAAGAWLDAHLAPRSAVALAAAAQVSRLILRAATEPAMAGAERLYVECVLPSHDASSEGVRAFVEKRQPRRRES